MTPEQAAAFINAQAAMALIELAQIKARSTVVMVRDGETTIREMPDVHAFNVLYERYEHVLGFNAVLTTFQGAQDR